MDKSYKARVIEVQRTLEERIRGALFDIEGEIHLDALIQKARLIIQRYVTEKLARTFSECVEWVGEGQRDLIDWYFAEASIEKYLGKTGMREFAEQALICAAYITLPEDLHQIISDGRQGNPRRDVIHSGGTWTWIGYKEQMKLLPHDRLVHHLDRGFEIFPQYMDNFLGRSVFGVYQQVKLSWQKEFPKGYGNIRFH